MNRERARELLPIIQAFADGRERNTRHKGQVNLAAAEAITEASNVSPETAKKIVAAIAKGKIPAVRIEY